MIELFGITIFIMFYLVTTFIASIYIEILKLEHKNINSMLTVLLILFGPITLIGLIIMYWFSLFKNR